MSNKCPFKLNKRLNPLQIDTLKKNFIVFVFESTLFKNKDKQKKKF